MTDAEDLAAAQARIAELTEALDYAADTVLDWASLMPSRMDVEAMAMSNLGRHLNTVSHRFERWSAGRTEAEREGL